MASKYLRQFEDLNTTCESIYDLGSLEVLIILKDGTNLTSWDDVENPSDVIYVAENLSGCANLKGKYANLSSLRAIVASEVSSKAVNMKDMFFGCRSLVDISSLESWDVSNVEVMDGMFGYCGALDDLSPLRSWDVSKLRSCEMMFFHCKSLRDISPLAEWNLASLNVNNAGGMFEGCPMHLDFSVIENVDEDILLDGGWNFTGWRQR